MKKNWNIKERKFSNLFEQILYNRGINVQNKQEFDSYISPNFLTNLHDPLLMTDMESAKNRIVRAIEGKEKIGVFSDYDADGVPAAALLFKAFKKLEADVFVYIPNREGGYGLSKSGIDYLVKKGCTLIITADLGIRNIEEAKYCKSIGVTLIITDHHLPGEVLPNAEFVINPKRAGDNYPFKELCGCGVAFKLVQAISKEYPKVLDDKFLKWNLDLVAISTICDVVPLISENRVIAKFGLIVLKKTHNIGLRALYKVAKIDPDIINSYQVGFLLGPRINAPGRIDHATKSFELLVTEDEKEAEELALWLESKNLERQAEMDEIEAESIKMIEVNKLFENKIIILAGHWSKGVIGPTASRLAEKYYRPVILFSNKEEDYTGSARSVSGVNIVELIEKVKSLVLKYGGHSGAAGLSVAKDVFEQFSNELIKIANDNILDQNLVKSINIDALVDLSELNLNLFNEIQKLEPFGLGNQKPIFQASDVKFENNRFVGKSLDHFSALACNQGVKLKTIYFKFPFDKSVIDSMKSYDIVFSISEDNWNNQKKLSLNIVDLKANSL